ncbi:unnamed protein product [Prunus armeniaca]
MVIRGIDGYQGLKEIREGQLGHLCSAPARCRSRTGFGSDSKVEFGSGPVSRHAKEDREADEEEEEMVVAVCMLNESRQHHRRHAPNFEQT